MDGVVDLQDRCEKFKTIKKSWFVEQGRITGSIFCAPNIMALNSSSDNLFFRFTIKLIIMLSFLCFKESKIQQ